MKYFNFYSNIIVTKGASRIIISDLQRNISELYPLELYELINDLRNYSLENIDRNYDFESRMIVKEYLDTLIKKEYGFISDNHWDENFSPLSFEYHDYTILSNLFIEINHTEDVERLQCSIENLGIRHLTIYINRSLSRDEFLQIDKIFETTLLEGIEIFSPFYSKIDRIFIQDLNKESSRISNLIFYNCDKQPFIVEDAYKFTVNFSEQELKISSCGKVNLDYFNTNMPKVLEAINHNSCLHKKISIDTEGNIRNCPSMPQSFGNIKETTLEEALKHKDFKKYWNLTKDHIEVCKDCEFRYICTDCRAYTERTHANAEGLDTSKPLKCGYDPYTGEWEEWSTNPLKEKAINYYGMQDFVKK